MPKSEKKIKIFFINIFYIYLNFHYFFLYSLIFQYFNIGMCCHARTYIRAKVCHFLNFCIFYVILCGRTHSKIPFVSNGIGRGKRTHPKPIRKRYNKSGRGGAKPIMPLIIKTITDYDYSTNQRCIS